MPYDADKFKLGSLCTRGHEYEQSGHSLRYRNGHACPLCNREMSPIVYSRERRDAKAVKLGYIDYNDYQRQTRYARGHNIPMTENKQCSAYLGIAVAENVLCKIFDDITQMPLNNKGYDFICRNGYKIDVKASCITERSEKNKMWMFPIKHNTIADYFLFIAFDDRNNLTPMHIWLIKSTETIRGRKLSEFSTLAIACSEYGVKQFVEYATKDKLEKTLKCCEKIKRGEESIDVCYGRAQ